MRQAFYSPPLEGLGTRLLEYALFVLWECFPIFRRENLLVLALAIPWVPSSEKMRPHFLTIAIKKGTVTSTAFKVRLVKTVLWALCSNSLSSESSFFLSICLFGHLVHGVSSRIAV